MAISNHERVGKALASLKAGLGPFVEREVQRALKAQRIDAATLLRFVEDARIGKRPVTEWDVAALLKLMSELWHHLFRAILGHAERSFVSELREHRNRWAHQESFSSDDAYRVLDTAVRLLTSISAPQAAEIEKLKMELLRVRFDEQARGERRKQAGLAIESAGGGTLKPWREVATPHQDVASGRYQQAEFAADLWQAHLGEGTAEYRDPAEFFRRTYLTESLKGMLAGAVRRLGGQGGDPVVQLQTNFGGGKTHSMLALYHLFSGISPGELAGIDAVLGTADAMRLPPARRVVLVGNKISPGNPVAKPDGTLVRTLWGELAWQLGGAAAYARVAADDERATSPGDTLRQLLAEHGPCLILIDEWVAYARQLHDQSDLPAGSFETQFTFAQVLTESAKAVDHCLLVISLPASDTAGSPHTQADDVEVGGQRGREALDRLRNVVGRIESSWRPASAEEGFEIVRRRLFEPFTDPKRFKDRDVVARAFADLYRTEHQEFPQECRDADYEKRLKAAYPIHPEIFDRLYADWSTLVTFQRTRGVLRLMAAVIHSLWQKGDRSPLILPANLSIDDQQVLSELTRYLPDNWAPVIEKDVDGPSALPHRLDEEVTALGKFSACRRVARTVYLGSAPAAGAAQRGIEDRRIKLGCVLPGESPAVFGDALRRLASGATYLYQDGSRYWYDTRPTVTKLAEDRAEQLRHEPDRVAQTIGRKLHEARRETGGFSRIHTAPRSGHDVPDERETRLVVLGPDHCHHRDPDSPAETAARTILESRGTAPRLYRNTLVFLAPDQSRLQDLDEAVRRHLAWESILEERELLDLSPHQVRQAETQRDAAAEAVTARLPETYQWLLTPVQAKPADAVSWEATRLTGQDELAVRVARRLKGDDLLATGFAGTRLRMELDRVPLWRGEHVSVRQLVDDFARYLYLPRLQDPAVLIRAVADGVGLLTWTDDSFAYADSFDEPNGRYRGLRGGQVIDVADVDSAGLVVQPNAARCQLEAERPRPTPPRPDDSEKRDIKPPDPEPPTPPPQPRRFHGTVTLDPTRAGRDASRIADEVITHLAALADSDVTVTLEVAAKIPSGAPDHVVRTVTENSRTLKFTSHGFERE
ncbi:MAG: ATP-binding protein [Acidobacteria bacterium]|nr:ATP-binding protein [Acidobacteriota bacterium]